MEDEIVTAWKRLSVLAHKATVDALRHTAAGDRIRAMADAVELQKEALATLKDMIAAQGESAELLSFGCGDDRWLARQKPIQE